MIKIQNKDIEESLVAILREHEVKRASLFGSYGRDEATSESDIDILVEFEGCKSLLDLVGLKYALEDSLGINVDVLTYESIHPAIRETVMASQREIL